MVGACEGFVHDLVVPLQGGGGIAVEGRADFLGKLPEVHVLGMQHAVAIGEMMHGYWVCVLRRRRLWIALDAAALQGRAREQ